jgi:hypothetical protein
MAASLDFDWHKELIRSLEPQAAVATSEPRLRNGLDAVIGYDDTNEERSLLQISVKQQQTLSKRIEI